MASTRTKNILVIGASGQLGAVLVSRLCELFPECLVVAADLKPSVPTGSISETLDATDFKALERIVVKHKIKTIYHLAAILSAKGEQMPLQAWDINMKLLLNVLEVSRIHHVAKVFYPSSIAVFGMQAPKKNTPQHAFLDPSTVYGMSKVAGEHWSHYYHSNYGLDVRSIRYPGVLGYQTMPGGGTTDYAVALFHAAIAGQEYSCFLSKKMTLPMLYMEDAIRATVAIMEAPKTAIKIRTSYNIAGVSFAPQDVAASIRQWYPDFKISYVPDFRQHIAESWPDSIEDTPARTDWGWQSHYTLDQITKAMIAGIIEKNNLQQQSA